MSKKAVGFSLTKIRPITRKNRKTNTENNSDYDSGSDYEEELPPLSPKQLPQFGPNFPFTYTPLIYTFDTQTKNAVHNPLYTYYFNNFLKNRKIVCNNQTTIESLINELIVMFNMPELNKTVFVSEKKPVSPLFFVTLLDPFQI